MENGVHKMKKEKERIYYVKEKDLINLRELAKKAKALQQERENLNKVIEELKDKYLRALAEFDNYRKRVEKEKREIMKYANENFILQLIPFDEIFESVLKHMEKNSSPEAIKQGLEILKKEFTKLLENSGVKKIKTKGEKFNPDFHEATGIIETDQYDENTIIEEEKPGYIYNERVIKPAMVKIAKKVGSSKENVEDKGTS